MGRAPGDKRHFVRDARPEGGHHPPRAPRRRRLRARRVAVLVKAGVKGQRDGLGRAAAAATASATRGAVERLGRNGRAPPRGGEHRAGRAVADGRAQN